MTESEAWALIASAQIVETRYAVATFYELKIYGNTLCWGLCGAIAELSPRLNEGVQRKMRERISTVPVTTGDGGYLWALDYAGHCARKEFARQMAEFTATYPEL